VAFSCGRAIVNSSLPCDFPTLSTVRCSDPARVAGRGSSDLDTALGVEGLHNVTYTYTYTHMHAHSHLHRNRHNYGRAAHWNGASRSLISPISPKQNQNQITITIMIATKQLQATRQTLPRPPDAGPTFLTFLVPAGPELYVGLAGPARLGAWLPQPCHDGTTVPRYNSPCPRCMVQWCMPEVVQK
jgi:hypothetical protein